MNIKGKKLLILGANVETMPIVRKAQELGVYVIVTDHIPNSPAKKIADGHYDMNGKDVDAIVGAIKRDNIDGVMVGVADPLISSYVEICRRMKFPCLVAADSIDFFRNKRLFKDECKKNGLPVLKEYFSCTHLEHINQKNIKYPMVVKPAVSRGGRGISYCRNADELTKAFIIACNNSDNCEVIGEEYINSEDVVATFLCENGTTHFLTMSDRILLKGDKALSTVTYNNIFPSLNMDLFKQKYAGRYSCLFQDWGIQNGVINIQMFCKDGDFIPYDPDCIINGESASDLFKTILGVDILGKFISYALTGNTNDLWSERSKHEGKKCMGASVWIILRPGIIGKIQGRAEIVNKEYLIDSLWRLKEGFEVTNEMRYTEKATLARIWIKANNRAELDMEASEIRKIIKVTDKNGKNMIEKVSGEI